MLNLPFASEIGRGEGLHPVRAGLDQRDVTEGSRLARGSVDHGAFDGGQKSRRQESEDRMLRRVVS